MQKPKLKFIFKNNYLPFPVKTSTFLNFHRKILDKHLAGNRINGARDGENENSRLRVNRGNPNSVFAASLTTCKQPRAN